MTEAENLFIEEYKKLEKICCDTFSSKNGISRYILEMEGHADGKNLVKFWDRDLEALKRIMWLQSRIAHDSQDSGINEEKDAAFVTKFGNRIKRRSDPLSNLAKIKAEGKNAGKHLVVKAENDKDTKKEEVKEDMAEKAAVKIPGEEPDFETARPKQSKKKKAKMYMLTAGLVCIAVSVILILFLILYFSGVL